jgi:gas vesicle protein
MSKGKFALGALFGAAAGFIAGIVTAPKSGVETRADIKARADSIKADVAKKAGVFATEAETMVDDAKDKAGDLKDRTERAVEGAKKGFFSQNKK